MKYYQQLIQHDPKNGKYGDCFRTVIACLLDLRPESVPHTASYDGKNGEKQMADMNKFLADMGLYFVEFAFPCGMTLNQILDYGADQFKGSRYTLTGKSTTGVNHFVACLGNEIEHDPNGRGIVGPAECDDGTAAWFIGLLGKII